MTKCDICYNTENCDVHYFEQVIHDYVDKRKNKFGLYRGRFGSIYDCEYFLTKNGMPISVNERAVYRICDKCVKEHLEGGNLVLLSSK